MWRRDAMILLFTLAIMLTFAECPRELERLKDRILISNKFTIFKKIKIEKTYNNSKDLSMCNIIINAFYINTFYFLHNAFINNFYINTYAKSIDNDVTN